MKLSEEAIYKKLLEKEEGLIREYNKLVEENSCGCGSSLLDDVHRDSCVDAPNKMVYKQLAKILYDLLSLGNAKQHQCMLMLEELGIKGKVLQIN
jgi:hypothetical protein